MIYSQDKTLGASEGAKNRNHNTSRFILNCVQQPTDVFCIGGLKFHMTIENRCATYLNHEKQHFVLFGKLRQWVSGYWKGTRNYLNMNYYLV